MTFVVGYAFPAFALVAADTRLNITESSGGRGYNDDQPLTLTLRDGSGIAYGEWGRKIRRYSWGWMVMGGNAALLGRACMDDLTDVPASSPDQVAGRLLDCARREGPGIRAQFGSPPSVPDRVAAVYIYDTPAALHVASTDTSTPQPPPATGAFRMAAPPDLPAAENAALQRELAARLTQPRSLGEIAEAVRFVARLSRRVHHATTSVSDRLEVGILVREGPGRLTAMEIAASNGELIGGTRASVQAKLRKVTL